MKIVIVSVVVIVAFRSIVRKIEKKKNQIKWVDGHFSSGYFSPDICTLLSGATVGQEL